MLEAFKITINGDINDSTTAEVFDHICGSNIQSYKQILVAIASGGGNSDAGFAICDILSSFKHSHEIITLALGDASSSALDIYMVGDRRYATEHTTFTLHRSRFSKKHASEHDIKTSLREAKNDKMEMAMLLDKLVLTPKQKYLVNSHQDVTFDCEEAYHAGIITHGGLPWDKNGYI